MDKKAFLAGDTLVYVYSIISLAVISILFSFLFFYSTEKPLLSFDFFEAKLEPSKYKDIKVYDYLDYYLFKKIRVNGKETTMQNLISLYCYNSTKQIQDYIISLSNYLLPIEVNSPTLEPEKIGFYVGCTNIKEACIKKNNWFLERQKLRLIYTQGSVTNPKVIHIPSLRLQTNACLEIESIYPKNTNDFNYRAESVSSQEIFEKRVKEIDQDKKRDKTKPVLIWSPKGDLWFLPGELKFQDNKGWCNIIENDCVKGNYFSTDKLIECKGDYLCLK